MRNKGYMKGMAVCAQLSHLIIEMSDEDADGFTKAIGEWYNWVEHQQPADWMKPYLGDETEH